MHTSMGVFIIVERKDIMIKQNIIEKLKKLMSFITIDGNDEEFTKLFNYIKEITPKHLNIKEYEFNNKKALVLSNTEDLNLDIIFATHIDVVPAIDYSFSEDDFNYFIDDCPLCSSNYTYIANRSSR